MTSPTGALLLSLIVSGICYVCINVLRPKLGFDDTLDVWGLHGMGGFAGSVLLPIFSSSALLELPKEIGAQIGIQASCAAVTALFSFSATLALLKLIGIITPLRLPKNTDGQVDATVYQESMGNFD